MSWPTAAVVTTNVDAGTDSPATARSDFLDLIQKVNIMIAKTEPAKLTGDTFSGAMIFSSTATFNGTAAYTQNVTMAKPTSGAALAVSTDNAVEGIIILAPTSNSPFMGFYINAVRKGLIGPAGASGNGITGSSANDFCVRSTSNINFSVNDGTSIFYQMRNTGLFLLDSTPKVQHSVSGTDLGSLEFSQNSSHAQIQIKTRDNGSGIAAFTGLEINRFDSMLQCQNLFVKVNASSGWVETNIHLQPTADNSFTCGASGKRWSAVWAANGTIQTSDLTDKKDIAEVDKDLATQFVKGLRPISFRWAVGGQKVATVDDGFEEVDQEVEQEVETDVALTEEKTVNEMQAVDVVRNGRIVRSMKKVAVKRMVPVIDRLPVFDDAGGAVMKNDQEQLFIDVPRTTKQKVKVMVMQKVKVPKTKQEVTPVEGKRTHFGFGAQDIKALCTKLGITDFGGWVQDDDGKQHLRPDQLIPFLAAALARACERLDALESK